MYDLCALENEIVNVSRVVMLTVKWYIQKMKCG